MKHLQRSPEKGLRAKYTRPSGRSTPRSTAFPEALDRSACLQFPQLHPLPCNHFLCPDLPGNCPE